MSHLLKFKFLSFYNNRMMEIKEWDLHKKCKNTIDRSIYRILLSLLTICSFSPMNAFDFEADGIYYNIISQDKREVEVTYATIGEGYTGKIILPEQVSYNNEIYNVSAIGKHAFEEDNNKKDELRLKSILLPNTITLICDSAFFSCRKLETIVIPASIKEMYASAFATKSDWDVFLYVFIGNKRPIIFHKDAHLDYFNAPSFIILPGSDEYYRDFPTKKIISVQGCTYTGTVKKMSYYSNINSRYIIELSDDIYEIDAGKYTKTIGIKCKDTESDEELFDWPAEVSYTINKAPLTINVNSYAVEYGEELVFSNEISDVTGFVNGESLDNIDYRIKFTCGYAYDRREYNKYIKPGKYTLFASIQSKNYTSDYFKGTLHVTKAPLHVSVDSMECKYGDYLPRANFSFKGLKNDETWPSMNKQFQTIYEAQIGSPVGIYRVNVFGGESDYYTFTYQDGFLSILPADLVIKAKDCHRLYYSSNPQFEYEFKNLKLEQDKKLFPTPKFECNADINSPCGSYEIIINGDQIPNYNVTYENGSLYIKPRPLTVTWGEYTRKYGEPDPEFKYTISGFVNNETETVLNNYIPTIKKEYGQSSSVGTYRFWSLTESRGNYEISSQYGYITIEQAEQHITWNQQLDNCTVGDQIPLNAEISSGLEIKYISGDESIATIYWIGDKPYLDCIKEGIVTIRATQDGDKNHLPAVRVAKAINILQNTGIDDVLIDGKRSNAPIYDMHGRQVNELVKGQIYIQAGKKFIHE